MNIFVKKFLMKKQIEKINSLLIEQFGVPLKAKKLPTPLDTIIGTILSQNTNDKNSYKAYRNLKDNFKNWDELAELTPHKIVLELKQQVAYYFFHSTEMFVLLIHTFTEH